MMMMMMMRRPSSLRVRAKPRHLPYIYVWAHPSSEKSSKVVFEHSNVPPVHTSKQKISVQEYIFSPDWPVANLLKSHGFLRQPQGWLGWPFSRGVLGWSRGPWVTVGFMGIHDLGRSRRLGGAHTSNGKATHSGIYLDYCSFWITPLCEFPWAMGWGIWDRPSWYIHPAQLGKCTCSLRSIKANRIRDS